MSDQARENQTWDRLFEFLTCFDEPVSDAEIDAELRRCGIDMQPAFRQLHKMVESHRAKARLAAAREARGSIFEKVRDIIAPKADDLRTGIRSLIDKAVQGQEQLAYFHKLEKAASEEDLQSLLDDLEKLATFREMQNGSQGG